MNKIYRVLWNEALNAWVAVAEIARACGRRSHSSTRSGNAGTPLRVVLRPMALALALFAVPPAPTFAQTLAPIAANALPTNGQIVGGAGSISQSGNKLTVNQTSDRLIANWQTFNIGKDAAVQFIQPGAGSAALNRVLDSQNPSQILGKLQANGQVYLVNPSGVFFGKGSQVDVAGLVATSQKLSDADFMARLNKFTPGGAGAVINEGKITLPPGGLVAFVAPVVKNSGEIHAPQGAVVLAAASEVDIDFGGDGLVTVRVKQSALDHLADNAGLIKADDGVVILTAGSARQLLAGAVNNSGVIEAKGISKQGGRIVLDGGAVSNSGTLDASSSTHAGGSVEVSGKIVDLGGSVNVSGSSAGQIVLDAIDSLRISGQLIANGLSGRGGNIAASAGNTLSQTTTARLDASGNEGGSIALTAGQDLTLEGSASATATEGTGGTISLVAINNLSLNNAVLDASGSGGGGRVHVQAGNSQHRAPTAPPLPEDQRPTLALNGTTALRAGSSRGRGGKVTLAGENIGLFDTTLIDASGATGGGTVLVGGDWQGALLPSPLEGEGPGERGSIATSQAVVMAETARINVSATKVGAGGTAVLWSEAYTGFYGQIDAKGGAEGAGLENSGGQVETSSHNNLQAMGNVDASASAGQAGNWLLDPWNVTITSSTTGGTFNNGSPNVYTPTATAAKVLNTTIQNSLNAGTSVTITTGSTGGEVGNITVSSAIATGTATGTRTLTLTAAGAITVGAAISNSTGTLDVVLNAGSYIDGSGPISGLGTTTFNMASGTAAGYLGIISKTNLIKTGTGTLKLAAISTYTGTTTINGGILQYGQANVISASSAVTVASGAQLDMYGYAATVASIAGAGGISTGGGALTVGGDNSSTTFSGIISGSLGTLTKTGSGTLTLSGANSYSGGTTVSAGTLLVETTGSIGTANATIASGATLATKKSLSNNITVNGTLDLQGVAFAGTSVSFGTNSTLTASTGTSSFSDAIAIPSSSFKVDSGSGAQLTLSGIISGSYGLTKGTGAGTVVLGNTSNSYSGANNFNGGVLSVADQSSLGTGGVWVFNGGTFQITTGANLAFFGTNGAITLNAGGGTIDVVSGTSSIYNKAFTGSGAFTKAGAGTLQILARDTASNTLWTSTAINVTAGTLLTSGNYASRNVVIMPTNAAVTVATGATWQTSYIEYAGSLSGGGNVVLGNYLAVGDNGTDSTFSGVISGAYYLYKNSTGTLTLSGTNSFSNLTINGGTVKSGAAGVVPDGAIVSLNGTSSWDLNGYNETVSEVYSNTNSTIKLGAGTLTTYAGTGTSFSGVISGTGGVTKTGAGAWVLTGANTYDGVTNITGGSIALSGSGTLGSSVSGTTLNTGTTLDLRGVTLSNEALTMGNNSTLATSIGTSAISGTITLPSSANNYINFNVSSGKQLTVDSQLGGTSSTSGIKNIGAGTTILTNANTYTGITTLTAGTLSVASLGNGGLASAMGAATNAATNLVFGGGTLLYSGTSTSTDRNFTLNAGTTGALDVSTAGTTLTWNGASTATTGALTKAGAGTLTLGGTNLYTGVTTVNAGTLVSGKAGVIADTSAVTVASGTSWNLGGFSETVASIAGAGDVALGIATLTSGGDNTTTTVSGVISGSGGLTKTGSGTLELSGANTYTGLTTISAGGIKASNNSALGGTTSGTTVASGATLSLNNALIGAEYLTLTGSLTNPGGSTSSFAGNITLGATSSVTVNGPQLTLSGVIDDATSAFGITKSGTGILVLSGINTYDGVTSISAGTLALSGSGKLGSTTNNTTIASGATLDLQGADSGTEAISIAGGTLKASGGVLGSPSTSTIGGTVTMTATTTVDAGTYDTLTLSGIISGAFGLTKSTGTGTVVLSGANTYTGLTTVSGGTLGVANALGMGTTAGGVSVASGATLDFQNVAVGAESMTALAGTLKASIGTSTYSGTIALTGNSVIDVGGSSLTLSGVISDAPTSTLTKNGAGTLILSGANTTYDGAVTVSAGTLAISNAAALGSTLGKVTVNTGATLDLQGTVITTGEPITLAGGTLAASTGISSLSLGTLTLTDNSFIDVSGTSPTTSLNINHISGSTFGFTKKGTGLLSISGNGTYTGATIIDAGTVKAVMSNALGTTTTGATTVNTGATLELPVSYVVAESIILHGGTLKSNAASGVLIFPGPISLTANSTIEATGGAQLELSNVISSTDVFGITKKGPSTLSFSGASANTYTGATNIDEGLLTPTAANRMAANSAVVVASSGTFSMGFAQEIGSLAGAGAVQVNGITLTTGRDNTATSFTGVLSGTGNLIKTGSGVMTLGGNNTYAGTTTVNAGTLAVTTNNALGTIAGSTTVTGSATLDFQGVAYSTLEGITLNGGTLSASTDSGTSSFAGGITLGANSFITVGSGASTQLTLSGIVTDGVSTFGLTKSGSGKAILTNTNTYDGLTTITGGTLSIAALGNIGTGNISLGGGTLEATNTINFASRTLTLTADSGLSAASTKTISGGVFSGAGRSLSLSGGGNFTLTNASNNFGTVTIPSAATVSLVDANDLTLGASTVSSLTAQAGAGGTGNFTLTGQITAATSSGTQVVLATGGGSSIFTNTAGANAIALTGSARWLIYSNDPYTNADSFGGLKSYNEAVFATTYPGAVAASGNRYVFAVASPANSASTLTASTIDTPKVYGDLLTLDKQYSLSYSTGARVFTEFSLAKPNWVDESTITLTSAGTPVTANVGSYQITIGGLVNTDSANKTLITNNTGNVIVSARPLTLSTTAGTVQTREYDGTTAATFSVAPTFTLGNIVNSDSVILTGTATGSFADKNVGTAKNLNWSGLSSSNANYALPTTLPTFSGDVTARTITLSATAQDKTYDQSTTATVTGLTGDRKISGDDLTYSSTSAAFASANVARNGSSVVIAQNVSVGGLALAGVNAGNYSLSSTSATTTATINPITLSLTGVTGTKVYDGSAVLSAPTFTFSNAGVLGGDTVTAVSGSATLDSRHFGTGKTLTANLGSLLFTGAQGGNYSLGTGTYDGSGDITAKAVTLTLGGVTRTYDGSLAYDASAGLLSTLSGQLGVAGDTVSAAAGTYDNANAGTGRTVTFASATLNDGNGGNNYTVTLGAGSNNSAITKADLTLSTSNVTKTYDGGFTAAGTATVVAGTLYTNASNGNALDTLSGGTFAFADKNAGSNKVVTASGVTVTDGNSGGGGNYTVSYADNTTSTISPFAVNLTGTRAYDGTTDVASGVLTLGTLVGSETLVLSGTGSVADKHVANGKAITIASLSLGNGSGGGVASNYTFTGGTQTVDVTQASLTLSTSDVSKTYDGDTTAAGAAAVTSGTLFAGDTLSGGSFAFVGANAGTGNKTVTVSGVTLNDGNSGNNYAVSYASNTTSTISQRAVNLTGTRSYDGTADVAFGIFTLGNVVSGEALTLTGTGTVANKHVGTGKAVTLGTLALGNGTGGLASNYTFSGGTYATNITTASLTLSTSNVTKTYDAGTTASGTATATSGTVFAGDSISGGTFAFTSKTASTGDKTVTASGVTVNDGNSGNNYAVSYADNTTSTINKLAITLTGFTAGNKVYDRSTTATIASVGSLVGVLSGDDVNIANTGATFDTWNVGTAKTVTLAGVSLGSTDGGNYSIAATATTTANITAKSLGLDLAGQGGKVYDGTSAISLSGVTPTLTGVIGGDTVGLNAGSVTGFADKNVGTGKAVTFSGFSLSGADLGNYTLVSGSAASTADITQASLTVTASQVTKTYDGGTTATGTATVGALVGAGEVVGTAATQAFTNKDVGSANKTVSASGLAILDSGSNDVTANYNITYTDNTTSTINPYAVSFTGMRSYDGTANVAAGIFTLGTLVGAETLTLSGTGTVLSKNVGTGKAVTLGSLALVDGTGLASNYTFTGGTQTAAITQANLTVTASQVTKTYDGGTTATGAATVGALAGAGAGETVGTAAAQAFTNKDAGSGNKTVSASGLVIRDSGSNDVTANYNITYTSNTTSTITQANLTVTAPQVIKTYDGSTTAVGAATVGALAGVGAGETVATAASIAFTSKDAAIGSKTVSASGLVIRDSGNADVTGNYNITYTDNTTSTINALGITLTGFTASNKVYDRSTTATIASAGSLAGVIGSDVVTVANSGATFGDWNVGSGKTVTLAGISLGGADGGNYSIAATTTTTANITAKGLGLDLAGQGGKVYDGTTAITLVGVTPTLTGVIGGDTVTLNAGSVTGFADKNAGTGKAVTFTGFGIAGADVNNYELVSGSAASSANITPRTLTVSYTGVDKTFDGTTTATTTAADNRLSGDSFTVASTANFADSLAGTNKPVAVTGASLSGTDAGNYTLAATTGATTATITALPVIPVPTTPPVGGPGSGGTGGGLPPLDEGTDTGGTDTTGTGGTDTTGTDTTGTDTTGTGGTDTGGTDTTGTGGTGTGGTDTTGTGGTGTGGTDTTGTGGTGTGGTDTTGTGGTGTGGTDTTGTGGTGTGGTDTTGTGGTGTGGTDTTGTGGTGTGGTDTTGTGGTGTGGTDTTGTGGTGTGGTDTTGTGGTGTGGTDTTGTGGTGTGGADTTGTGGTGTGGTDTTGTGGTGTGGTDTTGTGGTGTGGTDTTGTGGTDNGGTDTPLPTIPTPPSGGGTGTGSTGGGLPPVDSGTGTGGTGTGGTDTTGTGGTDTTGTGGTGTGGTDTTGTGGTGTGGTDTTGTGGTGTGGTDTPLPTIPTPTLPSGGGTGTGSTGGGLPPLDSGTGTGGTGTGGSDTTGTGGTGTGGADTTGTGGTGTGGTDTTGKGGSGTDGTDTTGTGGTGTGGTDTTGTGGTGTGGTDTTGTSGTGTGGADTTGTGGTGTGGTDTAGTGGTGTGGTDTTGTGGTGTGGTDTTGTGGTGTGGADTTGTGGTGTGGTDTTGTGGTGTGGTDTTGTGGTGNGGTDTTGTGGTGTGGTNTTGTGSSGSGGTGTTGAGGNSATGANNTIDVSTAGGERSTLQLPSGITLQIESGVITVGLGGSSGEGAGGDTAISAMMSVVMLKNGVPASTDAGVAVTEVGGTLTVSAMDGGAGSLSAPGRMLERLLLVLPGGSGAGASFEVDLTEGGGIVIRPRGRVAEALVATQRDVVIALAVAEARKQGKLPLENIRSIFIDQP